MSEPQTARDQSRTPAEVGGIRWDATAAVIASLVGLLALVTAGYTAYIQREQVQAQVWPYLLRASSDDSAEYMWMNKGVGPAIVRSVEVLVDRRPQQNWHAVLQSLRLDSLPYQQSTLSGDVLSPGQTLEWIKFQNHADFENFGSAAVRLKLESRVCYCSTLGDCWMDYSSLDEGWRPRVPIGKCPELSSSEQFTD